MRGEVRRVVQVVATFYVTALTPTGIGGGFDVIVKTRDVVAYEVNVIAADMVPDHIGAVVEALLGRSDVQSVEVREVDRGS